MVFSRAGVLLLALAGLVSCGADPATEEPAFSVYSEGFSGGLLLSVLEHEKNVWVVGGRPGASVVAKAVNGKLKSVDTPGRDTAWWVCPLGKHVAIVGDQGLILVETDDDFERIDLGIRSTLYGCAGNSRDDFWVVGGDPLTGPPELVHVVDGVGQAPELGIDLSELPKVFFKIARFGEQLVVAGDAGAVLMRNSDEAWVLENVGKDEPLFTVSGNSVKDFWLVGGRTQAKAYHYDGKRFHDQSPKGAPGLFGVAVAEERVLVAGHSGVMLERRENAWQEIPALTKDTLHAVWQAQDGHAWAVGGNVLETSVDAWEGVVLSR